MGSGYGLHEQLEVESGYGLHEQVEVGSGYGLHEQVEAGSGYGLHEHSKRPADVIAANWMMGKPAGFDFTVTSLLVSNSVPEASVTAESAAFTAEERKHMYSCILFNRLW